MSFICPTSIQSRSLWLGEIENWMDENFISKNFFHYGYKVKSVKIIRDKNTKTALGYGFVEFETPEIAKEVLNFLNGKLIPDTNKTFKLNSATYSAGKVASMGNFPKNEFTIYVGDLDTQVTEEKLKEFFSAKYKSVISTKIVIDNITKQSKGYGFVKFSDHNESLTAIEEMNGKYLLSRPIKTNQASFKKLSETNPYSVASQQDKAETPLNPITINNLNDFYIQPSSDNTGSNSVFNLSNFYINHGKYFSGNIMNNNANNPSNSIK